MKILKNLRILGFFCLFSYIFGFFSLKTEPLNLVDYTKIKNVILDEHNFKAVIPEFNEFEENWEEIIDKIYFSKQCFNGIGNNGINLNFIKTKIQDDLSQLSEKIRAKFKKISDKELIDIITIKNTKFISSAFALINKSEFTQKSTNITSNIKEELAEVISSYFTVENLIKRIEYSRDNSYFEFPNPVVLINYSNKNKSIDFYSFPFASNDIFYDFSKNNQTKIDNNMENNKLKFIFLISGLISIFFDTYNDISLRTTFKPGQLGEYSVYQNNFNSSDLIKNLKILGLNKVPKSSQELDRVYRNLAKIHHPDLKGGNEKVMTEINNARKYFKEKFYF